MNAICVDDEAHVLKHTVSSCQKIRLLSDVRGFTQPLEALDWIMAHPVDLALLDIDMPNMSGLELAKRINEAKPGIAIIFITAFSQYALDAYAVHPSSYLLKPFDQARLTKEVEYALSIRDAKKSSRITVQTFGSFEILVDGKTMDFRRSKAKELLAYLVDRRGAGVTRQDVFLTLWEDREYDVSMQKQMDVIVRSLRETLQNYGIGELFEMKNRSLRIVPEMIDCDLYRFLEGDEDAISSYYGEYMSPFAWANDTEAQLLRIQSNKAVSKMMQSIANKQ